MSRSATEPERRLRAAALASLRRIALIDLAGGWPLLLRYWLRAQVAQLIVYMSVRDSPRCYRAFVHFWEAATQFCRVRWLLASNHSVGATADATAGPNGDLTDDHVFGFHQVERFNGTVFRWSGTFAGIRLPAHPPPYSVVLAMPVNRPLKQTDRLIFSLNERFVSATTDPAAGKIRIRIEPDYCKDGAGNWLLFSIAPWSQARSTDPRRLGLPISGIWIESEERQVRDL
jgi:hypothetical protein